MDELCFSAFLGAMLLSVADVLTADRPQFSYSTPHEELLNAQVSNVTLESTPPTHQSCDIKVSSGPRETRHLTWRAKDSRFTTTLAGRRLCNLLLD